mmetsp:Transcript_82622/g.145754  ORF Transcript_82622/g.145754 Transcript_82622/m.145754 type:complete len:626 (+) Transcript_82622:72-1949(+)|eukprot:CAMPEP_0197639472 /NCGR_PEP_ID=MMETSP1338-20131121/14083_1 /TAXON_ID=43686 ORGANISM="Pelagodinium beii, Strain RCC1491" /NCGR_SAMPLE_ID=MMETSP1338 /ASSEMBLY_ACC=CAM_ASM_000754 /LENGTH=625 /DNA_ID=CAMNT_0043212203 /DNA_START=72 /DNA_END=1949 /DNA_ORIENTATION=-
MGQNLCSSDPGPDLGLSETAVESEVGCSPIGTSLWCTSYEADFDANVFADYIESPIGVRTIATANEGGSLDDNDADLGMDGYLGFSSIGTVVKTLHRSSNSVRALKQINKKLLIGDLWKEEVEMLQDLEHPHICKLHEAWEDAKNAYLVMELCGGGNLFSISNVSSHVLSETNVAVLLLQMVKAVGHLHEKSFVHSDVRPENWLFERPVEDESSALNMCLKMIDFGLANKHAKGVKRSSWRQGSFSSASSEEPVLTRIPMRKELKKQRTIALAGNGSLTPDSENVKMSRLLCQAPEQVDIEHMPESASDIWALGVIAYFLLSGNSPFETTGSDFSQNHSFMNARYVFMPRETWRDVSREAKHFIALCLQQEPERRPSANGLLDLPWMLMAQDVLDRSNGSMTMPAGVRVDVVGKDVDVVEGMADETAGTPIGARLSFKDPPLPMAMQIASSLGRIGETQAAERAAIIALSHRMHMDAMAALRMRLAELDSTGSGIIATTALLQLLRSQGLKTDELDMLSFEDRPVVYKDFLDDIAIFQRNMQESALWYVFRGFNHPKGEQGSDLRQELSSQDSKLRQCITSHFPSLHLDNALFDLGKDSGGKISYQELHKLLISARGENADIVRR